MAVPITADVRVFNNTGPAMGGFLDFFFKRGVSDPLNQESGHYFLRELTPPRSTLPKPTLGRIIQEAGVWEPRLRRYL
jgi:hypothetical protein